MLIDVMSFNLRIWTPVDGENAWPNRQAAVVSIINKYAPAILGTQEGLPPMLAGLDSALHEYERFGFGRDEDRSGEHNAVYFRKGQVKLVEQGQFWLSKEPSVPGSISWDSSLPRICTWGLFQGSEGNAPFAVFNTHLDHEGEDARRSGAELIWQKIEPLQAEGIPCILMGDFNCEPGAPRCSFSGATSKMHCGRWVQAAHIPRLYWTGSGRLIDYIFASPGVQILEAEIVKEKWPGGFPPTTIPSGPFSLATSTLIPLLSRYSHHGQECGHR